MRFDSPDQKAKALDHSRPIDVHRSSDHPEANQFVTTIYDDHFADWRPDITKRHIKVVLLDLYVAWSDDPDLKISVPMSPNEYTLFII